MCVTLMHMFEIKGDYCGTELSLNETYLNRRMFLLTLLFSPICVDFNLIFVVRVLGKKVTKAEYSKPLLLILYLNLLASLLRGTGVSMPPSDYWKGSYLKLCIAYLIF